MLLFSEPPAAALALAKEVILILGGFDCIAAAVAAVAVFVGGVDVGGAPRSVATRSKPASRDMRSARSASKVVSDDACDDGVRLWWWRWCRLLW